MKAVLVMGPRIVSPGTRSCGRRSREGGTDPSKSRPWTGNRKHVELVSIGGNGPAPGQGSQRPKCTAGTGGKGSTVVTPQTSMVMVESTPNRGFGIWGGVRLESIEMSINDGGGRCKGLIPPPFASVRSIGAATGEE